MLARRLGAAAITWVAAAIAGAQSVNIDFDAGAGPGAGSPTFGGAAGQAGVWNTVAAAGAGPFALVTVSGAAGPSLSRAGNPPAAFAFDNGNTTGQFGMLLDDVTDLGTAGAVDLTISNLVPGRYRVYTYSIQPDSSIARTNVTVGGSTSPNPQTVGGAMPVNSFVAGVTHAEHDVVTSTGAIFITAAPSVGFCGVNGVQAALVHPRRVYVRPAAVGTADGSSWLNAVTSLETALAMARDSGGVVQEIWVARAVYTPTNASIPGDARSVVFTLPSGCAVYGGFLGNESSLAQRNVAANPTVLSGELGDVEEPGDNAYHVVVSGATGSRLDGFTITGAYNNLNELGGGIRMTGGSLTIANCVIRNNEVEAAALAGVGGGLLAEAGSLTVITSTFLENSARFGGAISNTAATCLLENLWLLGNRATLAGGAVHNLGNATAVNVAFSGNTAGGAPSLQGGAACANSAFLDLINCTLSGNGGNPNAAVLATNPFGTTGARIAVTNSIVWGNPTAAIFGVANVSSSDIQGGYAGGGNFNANPRFVDADGADNIVGTLDDNLQLRGASPCIDRANNAAIPLDTADLDNDGNTFERVPLDLAMRNRTRDDPGMPDISIGGPLADVGAFEFQGTSCRADRDGNGVIEPVDIAVFVNAWFFGITTGSTDSDFERDGDVDPADIAAFIQAWFGAIANGCPAS
ncbi:MAG: hypothetical protein KF745_14615 [Phycisphaeraceae bacterium]|nr:hypothetical protein [Phycisphaeraceae bacterium]